MKYSYINGTDIYASKIVLGTDSFGSSLDEKSSFEMLDSFVSMGGTSIDTASIYADWQSDIKSVSEKTIGKWLSDRKMREKIVLGTKGGHPFLNDYSPRLTKSEINSDLENSLLNLKTDYIDIYWLHRDNEEMPVEELVDILDEIQRSGKARCVGVSNWSYDRIKKANEYSRQNGLCKIVASQIQFGIGSINANSVGGGMRAMTAGEYEDYCSDQLSMFAFSSQSKGYFAMLCEGKSVPISVAKEYENPTNAKALKLLKELTKEYGVDIPTIISSALICNSRLSTFAQVGTKKLARLEEIMKTSDFELEQSVIDKLIRP